MADALHRVAAEMLTLARRIESPSRQSTIYERMDRAAYVIARALVTHGPSSVNDLARALLLDGSTVTRQVAAMEARGQSSRRVDPADARAWIIKLTPRGRRDMEHIDGLRDERLEVLLAGWTDEEVDQFGTLLARFNGALAATFI